jgi:hypothetical protein
MNRSELLRIAGINKHGSEKAWRKYQSESGKKGGYTKTEATSRRGYGSHPDLAKEHANKRWGKDSA